MLLSASFALLLAWVFTLLAPYYMTGMHHHPLDEVAMGAHGPDLWPQVGPEGILRWVLALGLLTVIFSPVSGPLSVFIAGVWLVRDRKVATSSQTAVLVAALVLSLVTTALALSPFGGALLTWALD
jgi:hypothetical protein